MKSTEEKPDALWRFRSRLDGSEEIIETLWLYPEIECSFCVDEVCEQSGEEQLAYYVDYIRRLHRRWWDGDAVPILWSVRGKGICEYAPIEQGYGDEHFLTFYTPPEDARTGEPLNWWCLPVRNTRFPQLARALGWLPAPFQLSAPLRSICTNRTAAGGAPGSCSRRWPSGASGADLIMKKEFQPGTRFKRPRHHS